MARKRGADFDHTVVATILTDLTPFQHRQPCLASLAINLPSLTASSQLFWGEAQSAQSWVNLKLQGELSFQASSANFLPLPSHLPSLHALATLFFFLYHHLSE